MQIVHDLLAATPSSSSKTATEADMEIDNPPDCIHHAAIQVTPSTKSKSTS